MIARNQITGLVLAGGRGSRMGGVDKGLQTYRGRPLAQWMLERLARQVGPLMISANRHLADYRSWGVEVFADDMSGHAGPMAGIAAGLARCRTDWLATVPCDAPCFPIDLVERLARAATEADAELAMAVVPGTEGPRHQPVFSLMRSALAPSAQAFVARGATRVREWMFSRACVEVAFDDAEAFANLNTLDDLERAQRGG